MDNRKRRSFRLCYTIFCASLLLASASEAQPFFENIAEEAMRQIPEVILFQGCACGDYDNDGRPDLFGTRNEEFDREILLLHNEGGKRFTDQSRDIPEISPTPKEGWGTLWGDYDNDGDLDLFLPLGHDRWVDRDRDVLLRNDAGAFTAINTAITLEAGLADTLTTTSAVWLDYDRDGFLDLFLRGGGREDQREEIPPEVAQRGFSRLHRNRGDGTFAEVTAAAGVVVRDENRAGIARPMLAGDFNGDGWTDLFLAQCELPNIYFVNDSRGGFQDATTAETAITSCSDGIAGGDIDNDGDLDLFLVHSSGAGFSRESNPLYLNLGGEFLDITDGAGLGDLVNIPLKHPAFVDIDNDGDQDLFVDDEAGSARFLYLNQGEGIFVDATDQAELGRRRTHASFSCWLDFDGDGFLDVLFSDRTLYRNRGNDNHWLRVELVGIRSNRDGVGTRLVATAGDLWQMQEILGGNGYSQGEMVAHFGLGQRARLDTLEIRWPSGQVDVITDIPADQKIRVVEGRGSYHPVVLTRWLAYPDSLVAGRATNVDLAVRPALFEPGAEIIGATADLSALGGPAAVVLQPVGDGTWRVDGLSLALTVRNGLHDLVVRIDQQTSLSPHWIELSRAVAVFPDGDLALFDEDLGTGWRVEGANGVEAIDLQGTAQVHRGDVAGAIRVQPAQNVSWRVVFQQEIPVDLLGYTALRLAFHPGDARSASRDRLTIAINDRTGVRITQGDYAVDTQRQEWQVLDIPLEVLGVRAPIRSISLTGNLVGTFYLDDVRLVAVPPPAPATAVLEERIAAIPQTFTLDQNYPNPFNSGTVIRFALPYSGDVEFIVYNLAGQKVATLVEGMRPTGSYAIHWDGRDDAERELASGVYLYRLRVGGGKQVETRKLVLVR